MTAHKTFEINQHVLLKNSEGKILILQQDNKWMLPGGRLEKNESPEEGLLRELKEETVLENIKINGIYDVGISSSGNILLLTYKAEIIGEAKVQISSEHTNYSWVDINNIESFEFSYEANRQKIINCLANKF